MKYTTLLIDIDETILDFGKAERCALEATFRELELSFGDETFGTYHAINDRLWKAFERGEITKDVIRSRRFEQLFEVLGLRGDPGSAAEEFVHQLSYQGQLIEGAAAFLDRLGERYLLYAVTNGIGTVQRGRFDKADLWKYFKNVFISEQVGFGKPDKRYFDYVLEHIDEKDASKVLVIGDSPTSDIKGAQNAGLDSCLFNRTRAEYPLDVPPTYTANSYEEIIKLLCG